MSKLFNQEQEAHLVRWFRKEKEKILRCLGSPIVDSGGYKLGVYFSRKTCEVCGSLLTNKLDPGQHVRFCSRRDERGRRICRRARHYGLGKELRAIIKEKEAKRGK